jgi:hypothetical protein
MKILNSKLPIYLCVWNEGSDFENSEIHTKQSLFDEYKDTNLFSADTGDGFLVSLEKLNKNETYIDDNMQITRIR